MIFIRKAVFILMIFSLFLFPAFAQEEEQPEDFNDLFMTEFGLGIGALPGYGSDGSTGITIPVGASMIVLNPLLGDLQSFVAAGLRYEPGLIVGSDEETSSLIFFQAVTATGDFYLRVMPELDILPYAGLSAGLYQVLGLSFGDTLGGVDEIFFGIAPRIGGRIFGFNVYLTYHIIFAGQEVLNPSFFSIVGGYSLGGGFMKK